MPAALPTDSDRMSVLQGRLKQLGVVDSKLAQWGSGGQLYRFSCRANLANAANLERHFESVAAEPVTAVEEVLAKVESWRTAEQSGSPR
jgi:hypothetical protein